MTRSEVIDFLKANYPDVCYSESREAFDLAIKVLEEPEWKKGRWIKNDFYEDALMCSCCNAYLDKEDWNRHYFYFCYHCGAFMEGMDDGEEKTDED